MRLDMTATYPLFLFIEKNKTLLVEFFGFLQSRVDYIKKHFGQFWLYQKINCVGFLKKDKIRMDEKNCVESYWKL